MHFPCPNQQVDIRVDVQRLRQLIGGRLALIRSGASVAEAAVPWPQLPTGSTPPAGQAAAGQGQRKGQVRLARRLFDSAEREEMPDVAAVWAFMRHL